MKTARPRAYGAGAGCALGYGIGALPGGHIVQIGLTDGLQAALPDVNHVPGHQQKLLVRLPDVVHVDQKALMAPEEPPVPQLAFDLVEGLVDHVGPAGAAVQDASGVAALDIQDLVVGDVKDRGALPDLIDAGASDLSDPVHDPA